MFFIRINNVTISSRQAIKGALIITIFMSVVFLIILWNFSVKRSLYEIVSLSEYDNKGKIALLCEEAGNTGPPWSITQYAGVEKIEVKYIGISGYTPDKVLKYPLYIYMNSKFLFIGNFSKDDKEVFEVDEWYFVGNIERIHLILPYPRKCLNIFEIDL